MSRRPRLILSGFPHHITHRGNRRAPIIRDDADRRFYLSKLALYSERYEVRLYAYNLMRISSGDSSGSRVFRSCRDTNEGPLAARRFLRKQRPTAGRGK